MNIRTLRYFVGVVRQQSFARAAKELFITRPAISKMPKNLKDELNCILLIHDDRRLFLIDTGRVIFERGLASLAELRRLKTEFSDVSRLKAGVLRLGISLMVGMLITGSVGLSRQRYLGVGLKVSEFGNLTMQQAVMNDELNMALTTLPAEENGLTTLSLSSCPSCILTPHSGKWLECDVIPPETLAGHPLLIYNEDLALSEQLMKLFDRHDVKPRIAACGG